jgi:hypothetical protein
VRQGRRDGIVSPEKQSESEKDRDVSDPTRNQGPETRNNPIPETTKNIKPKTINPRNLAWAFYHRT